MKKRILTNIVAFALAFSTIGVACDNGGGNNSSNSSNSISMGTQFVWNNYSESTEAYVSDIYYYTIPDVQDEHGTTYEVFVDVKDADGAEVDSFGGFFLVEKPEEYKITYSIDNGEKIYSKVTTVLGIEKATYELADSNLIFNVNETINLDGKVNVSVPGTVVYSAKKGDEEIALDGSAFTATAAGIYTIAAKVEKQPVYTFDIYVVDKAERPYADGMVLDGVAKEDIAVVGEFDDLEAEVSFDSTKKYDSQSNGSYKIEAKTTGTVEVEDESKKGVAESRTLGFSLQPTYGSEYYKTLEKYGYKYIAVRYMIEKSEYEGTARLDYISNVGTDEMAIYYDGAKVVDKSEATESASYTYWNYQLDRVPVGAWAEMLLDISKFTMYYDGGAISLFQMVVNKNCSWDLTMYIDNIYAVKGEVASTAGTQIVDKGTEVDLSALSENTGITDPIRSITFDGDLMSVTDNKLKIDKYGLYSIDITDRTMYGSVKQDIIANGTIVAYDPTNFSAKHKTSTATSTYIATREGDKMVISSNGAGKIDRVGVTTYSVKLCGDKGYYEALQAAGYQYITYEYTLSYTGTASPMIYRYGFVTGDASHTNSMGSISYSYILSDGETLTDTSERPDGKQGFLSTSYPETWNGKTFTVSIPIQTVIDHYAPTVRILAFYFNGAAVDMDYSVAFGKIFPTKEACKFENN